ncbi:antitoxin VbhA family protein [Arthrobacter sp. I2-34]|uniref:Antitoxin VbhA family protein n=1 Tax=Arthrobacter hankyongi TaxID=2904801 RepID=A0ABS9L8I8_9MICC|nr:antitoxin VbhA family protein [Arthrobacter hankyongi]MCG2622995.1 antitoxin VbhA family protein [Arthrobacter hankyongi]
MLSSEQKRELTIDTMASWALDGMQPDRETVEDINAYLDGHKTLHELIEKPKKL